MNKKGMTNIAIIGIVLIIVLIVGVFAYSVSAGNLLSSSTAQVPGYSKASCPDVAFQVKGRVNVEDSAIFDLEPSLKSIDVSSVKVNSKLLKFGQEDFTFRVVAVDTLTGDEKSTFDGTGVLLDSDNEGVARDYILDFKIPDNNCDGKIDDFSIQVKAELFGADIGSTKKADRLLTYEGGVKSWN